MKRRFFFLARPSDVAKYASQIVEVLGESFDGSLIHAALSEALLNGILYGALGIAPPEGVRDDASFAKHVRDAEMGAGPRAGVTVEVEPAEEGLPATVIVRDPGPGFDWRSASLSLDALRHTAPRPGGLRIIRAGCRSLSWNESGNELRLEIAPLAPRTRPRSLPPSAAPRVAHSMRPPGAEQREPAALSSARPPRAGGERARVLVADDVETNRRLLELLLGAEGYEVECVGDGRTALDRIAVWAPHVAILDMQLAGMGALDVVRVMGERGLLDNTSVLVATATGDDARTNGEYEFLRKPVSRQELIARVQRKVAERKGVAGTTSSRAAAPTSLSAALRLMEALTPAARVTHGRMSIDALVAPCGAIGGDIVDVVPVGPSACAAVLLDVVGRGLPAALAAAEARSSLRDRLTTGHDLSRALAALNGRLADDVERSGHYVAFVVVLVDDEEGIISIANAGCPPVAVWEHSGNVHLVRSAAPPAGMIADAAFPLTRFDADLIERVVVVSDALASAVGDSGDTLGAVRALCGPGPFESLARLPRDRVEESIRALGACRDDSALVWITIAPQNDMPSLPFVNRRREACALS